MPKFLAACCIVCFLGKLSLCAQSATEHFTVAVASATTASEADKVIAGLSAKGVQAVVLPATTPAGPRWRIIVGDYTTREAATGAKGAIIQQTGCKDAYVLRLDSPAPQPLKPTLLAPATPLKDTTHKKVSSTETANLDDSTDFLPAYKAILQAMLNRDFKTVNSFIKPEQGLYVYYNPGAFAVAQRLTQYQNLFDLSPVADGDALNSYVTSLREYANYTPQMVTILPTYDCKTSSYSSEGLFFASPAGHLQQVVLLGGMKKQTLDQPLTPDELGEAKAFEQSLKMLVLDTYSETLHGLYFSYIGGHWYLAAIDLIVPCES